MSSPLDALVGVLRRSWLLIVIVLALDVLGSGYLYLKSAHSAGYQSCLTLFVADNSSPSMIAASDSSLAGTGALLAGETAANFFADDIRDVAQSGLVNKYISDRLGTSPGNPGTVSGARLDRTVSLCVSNPSGATAQRAATLLGRAVTTDRAKFIGPGLARRTFVNVITPPSLAPVSKPHELLNLLLRLILGAMVAFGLALVWAWLDPRPQRHPASAAA